MVKRISWEKLHVKLCNQPLHLRRFKVFYNEHLVLFEVIIVFDLGDSTGLGE